jgi:hypothetical protein
VRLIKAACRLGYHGLAVVIATAWDTGFRPVDARRLAKEHIWFRRFQKTEGENRQDCNLDIKRQDTPTDGQLSLRTLLKRFANSCCSATAQAPRIPRTRWETAPAWRF